MSKLELFHIRSRIFSQQELSAPIATQKDEEKRKKKKKQKLLPEACRLWSTTTICTGAGGETPPTA